MTETALPYSHTGEEAAANFGENNLRETAYAETIEVASSMLASEMIRGRVMEFPTNDAFLMSSQSGIKAATVEQFSAVIAMPREMQRTVLKGLHEAAMENDALVTHNLHKRAVLMFRDLGDLRDANIRLTLLNAIDSERLRITARTRKQKDSTLLKGEDAVRLLELEKYEDYLNARGEPAHDASVK